MPLDSGKFRLKTANLRIGVTLVQSLYDPSGKMVLAAGFTITERIKEGLLRQNVVDIVCSEEDFAEIDASGKHQASERAPASASPDEAVEIDPFARLAAGKPPLSDRLTPHECDPYDPARATHLLDLAATAATLVDSCLHAVMQGTSISADDFSSSTNEWVEGLVADADQTLASACGPMRMVQWSELSVRKAILSMGIATELKLDENSVRNTGLCALLHYWGQGWLPERLRRLDEPFSRDDWVQYMKYPLYTNELVARIGNLPTPVAQAAGQVQELLGGSGFPHGLIGEQIHPIARIVAVANAYVCLRTARRGRPALVPNDAMHYLLRQVKLERFDVRVVRATLNLLSLYPLASFVRLSDGSRAQVLRRYKNHYDLPIVRRFDEAHRPAEILHLSQLGLRVTEGLPTPAGNEMGLDASLLDEIHWDGIGS